MKAARTDLADTGGERRPAGSFTLGIPRVEDGGALWRIARDSEVLDLNSSYSYLLWCRDFAATSAVARDDAGVPIGFVTGYVRPRLPAVLVVWQVAVERAHRGRGIAGAMLDSLAARVAREEAISLIETTVTPDNAVSEHMFMAFAARHGAGVRREVLFDESLFPEGTHRPEVLHRIGPLTF
jgi:L-2,4-diaminobutyric acid acetyltransferase